jgi:hypothetical protein
MKLKFLLFTIVISGIFAVHAYSQNTGFGIGAGGGSERNTSIGFQAGQNTTAPDNTFTGHMSGSWTTTGTDNSFYGSFSGTYATTGTDNSFFGKESGHLNSGSNNSFFGSGTGYRNTGGSNSFFGFESGYYNSAGYGNSFVGYRSGYKNTTGELNTFLGTNSGGNNVSGERNTFVGYMAGNRNVTGAFNTFLGYGTGIISVGNANTYVGCNAGRALTAGDNNVFIGANSGFYTESGSGNVFIGRNAGYYETSSNKLHIANSSVPLIYGDFTARHVGIGTTSPGSFSLAINGSALAMGGVWTSSDRRFKQNEKIIDNPLGKIKKLQGVTYEFKKNDAFERSFDEGNQVGFIAQDLQQILPELVKQDGDGYLAVNYQGVIPVLVEAVKELSAQVEVLKTIVNKNAATIQNNNARLSGVSLEQNHPNPSAQSTTIRYTLSHEVTSSAIYIFDMQGQPVITFDNLTAGKGEINLMAQQLPAGLYYYTLVANGIIQDTKSMILTKN